MAVVPCHCLRNVPKLETSDTLIIFPLGVSITPLRLWQEKLQINDNYLAITVFNSF